MATRHRQERQALKNAHEKRWIAETKARAERLPRGFSGIWQRLTGKYSKIKQRNEREAWTALKRDRAERDGLIASQLDARRALQERIRQQRERQQADLLLLREDVARYQDMACRSGSRNGARPSKNAKAASVSVAATEGGIADLNDRERKGKMDEFICIAFVPRRVLKLYEAVYAYPKDVCDMAEEDIRLATMRRVKASITTARTSCTCMKIRTCAGRSRSSSSMIRLRTHVLACTRTLN